MARDRSDTDSIRFSRNNFDIIRTGAALLVLFSHSFALSCGSDNCEPLWQITDGQANFGRVAVMVFFVISGYLITESWQKNPDPLRFLQARALRLLPALLLSLVILARIVGPIISTLSAAEYFSNQSAFSFIVITGSLTGLQPYLPGVFTHNPHGKVDGALWTLTYEARCYLVVLALGLTKLLNRWTVLALYGIDLILARLWLGGPLVDFGSYFLAGSVLYFWQPPLRASLALLTIPPIIASALVGSSFRSVMAIAGAYLVLYIARGVPVLAPRSHGAKRVDLSYGIYIWAMPVQQIVTLLVGAGISWWLDIIVSLPVTIGCAYISWVLIEAPALRLKKQRTVVTAMVEGELQECSAT